MDPLVEETMDAYGYCYNNPIKFTDPDGRSPQGDPDPLSFMLGFIGDARAGVLNILGRITGDNRRYIGDDYIGKYQVAKKDSPSLAEDILSIATMGIATRTKGTGVFYVKTGAMSLSTLRTSLKSSLKSLKEFDIKTFNKTVGKGLDKYRFGKCKEFANDTWEVIGGDLKKIDGKGVLGHIVDGKEIQISTTGVHYFIEKVIKGETYIFDNVYRNGILKSEYEKSLGGFINGKPKSGGELLDNSKTVKSMDDLYEPKINIY